MSFAEDVYNAAWAAFYLNHPIMQVTQNTAQTFTTSVAATMNWTNVQTDNFASANLQSNTYTIPVAGWWRCSVIINFTANATGVRNANVFKNGVAQIFTGNRTGNSTTSCAVDDLIQCVVGDVITIQALQNSGGNLTTFITSNYTPTWNMEWIRS